MAGTELISGYRLPSDSCQQRAGTGGFGSPELLTLRLLRGDNSVSATGSAGPVEYQGCETND